MTLRSHAWLGAHEHHSFEVAALVVEYCYTDNLSTPLTPLYSQLQDLQTAASNYKVRTHSPTCTHTYKGVHIQTRATRTRKAHAHPAPRYLRVPVCLTPW